jgi:hypothetical protein
MNNIQSQIVTIIYFGTEEYNIKKYVQKWIYLQTNLKIIRILEW